MLNNGQGFTAGNGFTIGLKNACSILHTFGSAKASFGSSLAHGAGILLALNHAVLVGFAFLFLTWPGLDTFSPVAIPARLAHGAGSFQLLTI